MDNYARKYAGDAALMGAVALGWQDALDQVLDRYMGMVSRTSYRILCDRNDSEDITREVFIKVWKKASDFDGRCSLSTWIYGITCELCYGRLRRRKVLSLFANTPSLFETSAPMALSPEEDFITKLAWEIFCRASRQLSPKQRAVFTLADLEGLDAEEVEAVTGMTPEEIKTDLYIARKKIRQELEHYGKVR